MKSFIHLFSILVIPVNILFVIISIIYFSINFELSQAIKLGVLSGVLAGTGLSVVIASALLVMRRIQKSTYQSEEGDQENDEIETRLETQEAHSGKETSKEVSNPANTPIDQTFMVLMDTELVYEIALYAVSNQNIGKITQDEKHKGFMVIQAEDEIITLSITSVTRHSANILITSIPNSKNTEKLISYIKEKEYSFLDY